MKCRFAPSPTGKIHVGNARSALLNWAYAINNNGKFILRIDDTDSERSKEEFINSIKEDLKWLNINWELTFKQSERNQIYNKKIQELKNINRLYPCFETQEELLLKRKSLLSSGKPPIYDRGALKLSDREKEDLISKCDLVVLSANSNHIELDLKQAIDLKVKFEPQFLINRALIGKTNSYDNEDSKSINFADLFGLNIKYSQI